MGALHNCHVEVFFDACAVCYRPCDPCGPKHCMLCFRRIHPWCASSPYEEADPILCRFRTSSPSGRTVFQAHNVMMRHGFDISGCATAAAAPIAPEEPAITVPSSRRDVVDAEQVPLVDGQRPTHPSIAPFADPLVCVQTHRSSQTPPLIVPDIHRVLEGTGILECPDHKLDHGVPDPKCDYCKRALGPLYRHSALREAREVPILTFDFSGPHPSTVHPAKQLMVVVWCLRDVRLIWAMGVENRDDPHVVAGLQVALDDPTSLTGGCRAPVLRLHSDKAKEFLATSVRKLLRTHGIRQTTNSGYDPAANGIEMGRDHESDRYRT